MGGDCYGDKTYKDNHPICEYCEFKICSSCYSDCPICGRSSFKMSDNAKIWKFIRNEFPSFDFNQILAISDLYLLSENTIHFNENNNPTCDSAYFRCKDHCSHENSMCQNHNYEICTCCFDSCPICDLNK